MITEFGFDGIDDFGASFFQILVGSGGFIDEDEGGFIIYPDTMKKFTLETGLFNEPTRINFEPVVAMMDWDAFCFGVFSLVFGKVNILEERASARGGGRIGKFVGANLANDLADALRREIGNFISFNICFN